MAHNVEPVVDAIPAAEKTGTTETTETTGQQTYLIPLRDLLPPDSPRLAGESVEHIRLLAEVAEALPPILVHRNTMKIIDGAHRVGAARLRGETSIRVRFFDGTAEAAFVEGVRANTTNGLPLSRADREAAALRIAAIHPTWSHRAIAAASGLSDKTVKQLRLRSTGGLPHLDTRVGLDGRFRPITAAPGRERAAEALASRPDASLREIARLAGVSPGTVRNVRERLRRGEDPLTVGRPRATGPRPASTGPAGGGAGRASRAGSGRRPAARPSGPARGRRPAAHAVGGRVDGRAQGRRADRGGRATALRVHPGPHRAQLCDGVRRVRPAPRTTGRRRHVC